MNAGTLEHTERQSGHRVISVTVRLRFLLRSPTRDPARDVALESHLLPDLSEVPAGQQVQVGAQGAGVQHPLEAMAVVWATKQDVVPEGGILDPGLLGHIGH